MLLTPSSIRYYLSERFRLRFEDSGLDDMMDENEENAAAAPENQQQQLGAELKHTAASPADEGVDMPSSDSPNASDEDQFYAPDLGGGAVRTLDGEIAGDEFAQDAINYQILLGKIDRLLEGLKLDA